jgi:hypothetical protein
MVWLWMLTGVFLYYHQPRKFSGGEEGVSIVSYGGQICEKKKAMETGVGWGRASGVERGCNDADRINQWILPAKLFFIPSSGYRSPSTPANSFRAHTHPIIPSLDTPYSGHKSYLHSPQRWQQSTGHTVVVWM